MSKFKVRLKITGFELEVEGSRAEVPLIGQNLSRQIAGLIAPASNIVQGEVPPLPVNGEDNGSPASGRKSSGKGRKSTPKEKQPLNWSYDGETYGMPQQIWSTADKAIWLLYVAEKAMAIKEVSTSQITSIFNNHYRAAKPILQPNDSRDLNKLRI